MARRRKSKKQEEETLVDLVEARESAQDFLERNQNIILAVVGVIVLIAGGYFAYKYLYKIPRQSEAMEAMYQAEQQFGRDSFALALDNPGGGNPGFLDIVDQYGDTKAGNLARYYAGVSWLNLGEAKAAVDLLEDFNPKGTVLAGMKHSALGDAYAELNEMEKAEKQYKKAANVAENEIVASYVLQKMGMFYLSQGNPEEAAQYFERLKKEYPKSPAGMEVDKYLSASKNQ